MTQYFSRFNSVCDLRLRYWSDSIWPHRSVKTLWIWSMSQRVSYNEVWRCVPRSISQGRLRDARATTRCGSETSSTHPVVIGIAAATWNYTYSKPIWHQETVVLLCWAMWVDNNKNNREHKFLLLRSIRAIYCVVLWLPCLFTLSAFDWIYTL